jgi:hypothetical protein
MNRQYCVVCRLPYVFHPLRRNAIPQQLGIGDLGKERRLSRREFWRLDIFRNDDFLDRLPNLHQLGGTCLGMGLQLSPFSPVLGLIVVIDVTEEQTPWRAVDN